MVFSTQFCCMQNYRFPHVCPFLLTKLSIESFEIGSFCYLNENLFKLKLNFPLSATIGGAAIDSHILMTGVKRTRALHTCTLHLDKSEKWICKKDEIDL